MTHIYFHGRCWMKRKRRIWYTKMGCGSQCHCAPNIIESATLMDLLILFPVCQRGHQYRHSAEKFSTRVAHNCKASERFYPGVHLGSKGGYPVEATQLQRARSFLVCVCVPSWHRYTPLVCNHWRDDTLISQVTN